jgi:peptide deformylase
MPLSIVHYNDPVLRKKGAKITAYDAGLRKLAQEMVALMHAQGGIGLAAQQVGEPIQVCVVDLRETDLDFDWELDGARPPLELFMPMVVTNPEVSAVPDPVESVEEGCLSFPGIRGPVERPEEITVKYKDEHGTPHVLRCNGLFARCVQHESDHLNGVLFIDRMDKSTLAQLEPELKALRKQTRESAKKGA